MAYAGQSLENPLSGQRIVFRETADTAGERYRRPVLVDRTLCAGEEVA